MKKFRSLFLGVSLLAMLVSSCTPFNLKSDDNSNYQLDDDQMLDILTEWNPEVHVTHDENFKPVLDGDFEEIPEDKQARLSSSILDAKRNSKVGIVFSNVNEVRGPRTLKSEYQKIIYRNNANDYLTVTNVDNDILDVLYYAEDNRLSVTLNDSFRYGEIYFVNLYDENLSFESKDPSIRRLTIEIEDDPSEPETIDEYELDSSIPVLGLSYVTNEDVDENSIYSFDYSGSLPSLTPGEIFLVKQDVSNDELGIIDFYGEFVKQVDNKDGTTRIYYEEPEGDKIYKKLRRKSVELIDFTNVNILVDEDTLQRQIRYSDTSRALLSFFAKEVKSTDSNVLGGILDQLHFDFTFNYYDGKFTFSFSIYVSNIELYKNEEGTAGLFLTLKYEYTRISEYHIDFDVGLKKKWFVPVGVSYKVKMVEDIEESHTFYVIINDQNIQDESSEKIKNDLANEVSNAKAGNDNFFKKVNESDEAKAKTEGNKTTIPLFEIEVPVYEPLMFQFRMELIIDLTVEAMFFVKKQWKSNRVVLNFSNKSGGDSDTHQDVKEASSWDFYFMGLAEFRVAFRLSGALYIKGTYKFLHVELYAEFYVKIGIQGNLSATITNSSEGEKLTGNVSIDLYVLMGAKVGLDIVIAIFDIDFSVDLFKTYILRVHFSNDLECYSDDSVDTINLDKTIANINDYDILKFRTWDGVKMRTDVQKMAPDSEVYLIESWLGDLSFRMFTFEVDEASKDLITITDSGEIQVAYATDAQFTAKFTVKVNPLVGFIEDKVITINFNAPDAHNIYIKDDETGQYIDIGKFRPGAEYTLKLPEERDGYRFESYLVHFPSGDQVLNVGDTIKMIEGQDLYIDINWHKIIYYTVYFLDGHNNVVYVDSKVEENTTSSEPTPEIRDQFMEGYFFVGWDKSFVHVTSDLIVRGIYMQVR